MTDQGTTLSGQKECQTGLTGIVLFYFFALSLISFLGWGSLNIFLEGMGKPLDGLYALIWLVVFFVVAGFFSRQLRCSLSEEIES
ncbi:hypothetical protein A7Q09_08240 [Methylacidiphilum sp. Yel]|jgi:hypothetical protein|uniref:hypothetical protein n=1 Tax=Methylacidiphilum sp. Yel TaxID=1847730 RepID=UPI00106CFE8D|nr:hypothetical protein [Methylacidiphilum sp. Yel]TFE67513.1 hypothetical protein A7Q09_08240 [Methylacidiphilum sp. Yel]